MSIIRCIIFYFLKYNIKIFSVRVRENIKTTTNIYIKG